MGDERLRARLESARLSAWPRIELLLEMKDLGLDALTNEEIVGFLRWLNSQAADRIVRESERPATIRIFDAVRRGLIALGSEMQVPSSPPELVNEAFSISGVDPKITRVPVGVAEDIRIATQ